MCFDVLCVDKGVTCPCEGECTEVCVWALAVHLASDLPSLPDITPHKCQAGGVSHLGEILASLTPHPVGP